MFVPCYFCEGLLNTDNLGFCPYCGGSIQKAIERAREYRCEDKEYSYFVDGGRTMDQQVSENILFRQKVKDLLTTGVRSPSLDRYSHESIRQTMLDIIDHGV